MFFNALGKFALGQATASSNAVILVASAGAYTVTGASASFTGKLTAGTGSYTVTGMAAGFKESLAAAAASYSAAGNAAVFAGSLGAVSGAYALTGKAAPFVDAEIAQAGSYALSGQAPLPLNVGLTPAVGRYGVIGAIESFVQTPAELDALGRLALGQMSNATPIFAVSVSIGMRSASNVYAIQSGANTLERTGADFDLVYGGVGHYLEEIQRLKQLRKITRKTPGPIVQPPMPRPQPLADRPGVAQPAAIDTRAIAAQQIAEQQQRTDRAGILRRRRQEAELLLLAS